MAEPRPDPPGRSLARAAGHASRVINDVASQTSGAALVAGVAAVFIATAVGGLSLIGALGTFGWIVYFVLLGVLALALGPLLAAGVSVRRHGSARHRQLAAERLESQRRKFSLDLQAAAERRRRAELQAEAEQRSSGGTVAP